MKKIVKLFCAVLLSAALTACGSGEPASAPSVADSDKAAVQEKLNKQDNKTDETKSDDKQSDEIAVTTGTIDKGNTQIVAEYIADEVGADSFHIETVTPYPADYNDCCDVAKQELADKARPELSRTVDNMEQYDIVFLGYPIWWGDMPMAVYTFMDSYDFSDKVIIPFNTHEGSGESGTYSAIGSYLPNAQVLDGMAIQGKTAQEFNSDTQQSVRDWLDGLGF